MTEPRKIRVKVGKYIVPLILTPDKPGTLAAKFPFHRGMIAEIKTMQGAIWHGFDEKNPRKIWTISDSPRNDFQLRFLSGENPYAHYEQPLIEVTTNRPLREHQLEMKATILTYRQCLCAYEMGTGKTLAAFEALEDVGIDNPVDFWYVGPRAGVKAVSREIVKWDLKVRPRMMTYEGLKKLMKNWETDIVPKAVVFDESSKIKTPTSQRSQAAMKLANKIRATYGMDGYIIEMTGTPAPRTPEDWWHQCEIACPGFLKEGTVGKFKSRLCIIEQRQSVTGGIYPHIVTWKDDIRKCDVCGMFADDDNHNVQKMIEQELYNKQITDKDLKQAVYHKFVQSKDEISYLFERMKGLVSVKFKEDCLDLPEKQWVEIYCTPTAEILRAARIINARSTRAIEALTLLRELSDGFQYTSEPVGKEPCPACLGKGTMVIPVPKVPVDTTAPNTEISESDYEDKEVECGHCGGAKEITKFARGTEYVHCPKDQLLIDDLDEHSDIGRFTVWGAFTATIDRLTTLVNQQGWHVLRIDGRGYHGTTPEGKEVDSDELLDAMDKSHPKYDDLRETYPRVCVVGHPGSGGMALTLTATPTQVYFSNPFSGEARMQSADRGHRMGMDLNRGYTLKDYIHLPSDKLVKDNLDKKVRLQSLTMGQVHDAFKELFAE